MPSRMKYPFTVLLLLSNCLVFWIAKTVGQLSTVPKHTIAKLGDRVELECSKNETTSDPSEAPNETNALEWKFSSAISTKDEIIYHNGYINHKFSSKYTIDNATGGKYNLIMKANDLTFAGTYTCCEQPLYGEDEPFCVSAELIVIESDPICNTNQNSSLSGMTEGDYIRMWCTVNYSGNWILVMEWTTSNGRTVDADILHVNTSTTVTSSLITQLTSNDNGVTFTCKTSFKSVTNFNRIMKPGETVATNIPTYQHLWNFTANVLSIPAATAPITTITTALTVAGVIAVIGLIALGLGVALTVKAWTKGNSMNRKTSKESSIQNQNYEMVDESNVQTGNPPLNQSTSNEEGAKDQSAENVECEGYASLKRSSSATFAQPAVYAQLQLYAN